MSTQLTKNQLHAKVEYKGYRRYVVFRKFLSHIIIGALDECWEWDDNKGTHAGFSWPSKRIYLAHVAAYLLFNGLDSIPKKHGKRLYVCHSCDNPPCVNPKHLWLGTQKENMDDMVKKGRSLHRYGKDNPNVRYPERYGNTKLTQDDVDKIRKKYATGDYTMQQLGNRFGVTKTQISAIINRKRWK